MFSACSFVDDKNPAGGEFIQSHNISEKTIEEKSIQANLIERSYTRRQTKDY